MILAAVCGKGSRFCTAEPAGRILFRPEVIIVDPAAIPGTFFGPPQ
jgi:hypothetical protein